MMTLKRLAAHPMSAHVKDFIMNYRKEVMTEIAKADLPMVGF